MRKSRRGGLVSGLIERMPIGPTGGLLIHQYTSSGPTGNTHESSLERVPCHGIPKAYHRPYTVSGGGRHTGVPTYGVVARADRVRADMVPWMMTRD
jgi:hypothetical protein